VTVFYQIAEKPLMTVGGGQFVSDAIDVCGGRNIFAGSTVMAPVVNLESVIAADPMAILTARVDPADRSWEAFWRRFPGLFAVELDNLYTVPANEMHRHGPRAFAATRLLCERIDQARVKAATRR
jgi:iron complex transport system substrate-binding protein